MTSIKVLHMIYPVRGFLDLQASYHDIIEPSSDTTIVILLNCGGGVDIHSLFNLEDHEDLYVIICDSHRPYHINNVKNDNQILIMDDSTEDSISFQESQAHEEEEVDDYREKQRSKSLVANHDATSHGFCSAGLLYALSTQTGHANNTLLWYAIIGLTDQFVHQRIDYSRYNGDVQFFKAEVLSRNVQDDEDVEFSMLFDQQRIIYSKEYIFMLYRHWNLYDSMYHTNHITIRFEMWKSEGKRRLDEFLTLMGIPLDECKQSYSVMSSNFKDQLYSLLDKYSDSFGIDIYCPSFNRRISKKQVSAIDTVFGVSALLDSSKTFNIGNIVTSTGSLEDKMKSNFWIALQALGTKNSTILEVGFKEAIEIQQAIVNVALMVIKRNEIIRSGPFRYVVLKESNETKTFAKPQNLAKLAHILVDYLIESGKRKVIKPLIVVYKSEDCTIVGVEGQHSGSAYIPKYVTLEHELEL